MWREEACDILRQRHAATHSGTAQRAATADHCEDFCGVRTLALPGRPVPRSSGRSPQPPVAVRGMCGLPECFGLGQMLLFALSLKSPVYSACLRGFASILFTAVAVWHCPYPVYGACCAALPLSCLQRLLARLCFHLFLQLLLCGIAPILFTALAVRNRPYPVYSACLRGFASI